MDESCPTLGIPIIQSWKNHSNFSWKNDSQPPRGHKQTTPQYPRPSSNPPQNSNYSSCQLSSGPYVLPHTKTFGGTRLAIYICYANQLSMPKQFSQSMNCDNPITSHLQLSLPSRSKTLRHSITYELSFHMGVV